MINVLNVVHESVLLNPGVTKTMKIDLFTPTTTRHLLDLYKWMGPIGKLAKGGHLEDLESDLAKEVLSDRARVTEALQKFMMTLCTSTTEGIIFKEKIQGGSIKSNNWYVYKILTNLKTPWEDPGESELMSCFLGKCPDLLKTYMPSLKSSLRPRPTKAFVSLMNMVTRIIDTQTPWMKLEAHGAEGAVACIVPQPLITPYIRSLLESFSTSVRFSGIKLVLSILSKTKETTEVIKNSKELLPEMKQNAQDKIQKIVFRTLRLGPIITCWEIAVGQKTTDTKEEEESSPGEVLEEPPKITELLHIVKALTLFNELQPNEALQLTLDPLKMLDVVQRLPEDSSDSLENSKAKLELQVLCLELLAHRKQSQDSVIDSSTNEGESSQNMEENILYKLICTYAQSGKEILTHEDEHLRVMLTEKCFRILSTSLAKVGLPAHYDGSVKVWLRHVTGERDTKLASFLTTVIQKAASSLHQYTDAIIKITNSLKEHVSEGEFTVFMNTLDTIEICDNREVSNVSISLPFSRLVLAAVDLLERNSDPDHVEYFSKVITDYQYSVNDPELLTTFLLQNENILTSALVEYLKSCGREGGGGGGGGGNLQTIPALDENPSLSETLKYLFMTNDLPSVEGLLEKDKLKEHVSKKDLDLVISQLLLYIHLRSDVQKGKGKVLRKYVDIVRQIYFLHETSDLGEAEHVLQTVLEHPRIISAYQPFSTKTAPVTDLAQDFLASVLQTHPTLISCTVPYFTTIRRSLEGHVQKSDNIDYWRPVMPFITSKQTIISYEAAEQMLVTCLKSPSFSSASLETLMVELVKLISKTTSGKRKLSKESVEVLFNKFLEWGRGQQESASQDTMKHLEHLLTQVFGAAAIEQLTSGQFPKALIARQ